MGLFTTYLIARHAARRQIRKRFDTYVPQPGALPEFHCSACGDRLVLSIHWPGIDPIYWEDHLGGICTNCFDN